MLFEERTGVICSLLVPDFQGDGRHIRGDLQLPWSSIVIVGEDIIIFRS